VKRLSYKKDARCLKVKEGTFLPSITAGFPRALLPQQNVSRVLRGHRPNNYPSLTKAFCYVSQHESRLYSASFMNPDVSFHCLIIIP